MMHFDTFLLERNQTLYENDVELNLTESGLHPASLSELLSADEINVLVTMPLGYGYTDGRPSLRAAIATWYPGATAGNIAILHGASEANMVALLSLLSPGDELLVVLPNFLQLPGLARALGIAVLEYRLPADRGFQPDVDAIEAMITPATRMIALANPNNPTGQIMAPTAMAALARLADRKGVWLLADEIYRGAEIDRPETPTFYGLGERVVVTSSLSKAFANPGLRLGWMVAPVALVGEAERRQDYTSIGTGTVPQFVAERVVGPEARERVLGRGRALLSRNAATLRDWLKTRANGFDWVEPHAGAFAFLRYAAALDSESFVTRLREEEDLFLVAGSWFGIDGHLRIGLGGETAHLEQALDRLDRFHGKLLA